MAETGRGLRHRISAHQDMAERIATVESYDGLVQITLTAIGGVIPCDLAVWNEVDLASGGGRGTPGDSSFVNPPPAGFFDHRSLPLPLLSWYESERQLVAQRL